MENSTLTISQWIILCYYKLEVGILIKAHTFLTQMKQAKESTIKQKVDTNPSLVQIGKEPVHNLIMAASKFPSSTPCHIHLDKDHLLDLRLGRIHKKRSSLM